jgi:hypothetical protein
LETLWPTRRTATPEALNAAATAWDAFRAPEPTALAECAERGSPQLPFLRPALRRLLEELQRTPTGACKPRPRSPQARALRLTAEGKRVLRGESDRVDLLGVDRWIGGSHVTPENTWRWDRAGHRLLAPPTSGAGETGPE